MQVEVQLLGKPNRWRYQQGRIRIGRDASCDISLPSEEFPMVSREHVVLTMSKGVLSFTDWHSTNGTYLRGVRLTSGTLRSGDALSLGASGPMLIFTISDASPTLLTGTPAAPGAEQETRVQFGPEETVFRSPELPTDFGETIAAPSTAGAKPVAAEGKARGVRVALPGNPLPANPPKTSDVPVAPEPTNKSGETQMIEQQLSTIRTLLVVNLIAVVVLIVGLFYEGQQIERNRKAVVELQTQAQSAVGQFQPELDSRLKAFDQRVDSIDGKMKTEEDHMVQRMNTEIPAMLDKYIDQKMHEAKGMTPPH